MSLSSRASSNQKLADHHKFRLSIRLDHRAEVIRIDQPVAAGNLKWKYHIQWDPLEYCTTEGYAAGSSVVGSHGRVLRQNATSGLTLRLLRIVLVV